MQNQARRIVDKFGGARKLAAALRMLPDKKKHRDDSTIYRWLQPKSKKSGTGGLIPTSDIENVKEAARLYGVLLTANDFYGD